MNTLHTTHWKTWHVMAAWLLVAIVTSLLFACQPNVKPEHQAELALQTACNGYASTVRILAVRNANGGLTPDQVAQVDRTIEIVHPICRNGDVAGAGGIDAALDVVERRLLELNNLKQETQP